MKILDEIRELAKSHYYQTIYNNSEKFNLKIFNNDRDLSGLQILFINYLNFYNVLIEEIVTDKVSEKVLENFIYEDSYMMYRKEKYLDKKSEKQQQKSTASASKKGKQKVTKDWRVDMHRGKMKQ